MERELTDWNGEIFEMVVVCGRNPRQIPRATKHVLHIHSVDGHLKMSTPPSNSQTQQASNAEPSSSSSGTSQPRPGQTADEARKDRTLAEFLLMLDDYEPLVTTLAIRVPPLISNSP